jgi:hypothetical protein
MRNRRESSKKKVRTPTKGKFLPVDLKFLGRLDDLFTSFILKKYFKDSFENDLNVEVCYEK